MKDSDDSNAPLFRDKPTSGIRRRIEFAEQLADQAVAAESDGDHKAAADFYRQAIDALALVADEVSAAANHMADKEVSAVQRHSRPPENEAEG